MNQEALQALIIDRHLGELSPEAAQLLDTHLDANPSDRAEEERILAALSTVRQAVLAHPEMAQTSSPAAVAALPVQARVDWSWLARAAGIVFLASLSGFGGFLAGRSQSTALITPPVPSQTIPSTAQNSPWTRYHIASKPGGAGLQIVRLETRQPNTIIQ